MRKLLLASLFLLIFMVGCKDEGPEPIPPVPIVSITSMSGTTNVVDSTYIEIGASDDKGVIRVELYYNNTLDTSRVFIRPPYRWLWNAKHLPDSSLHTFFARAYDADGNVSTSPVVVARVLLLKPNTLTLSFINDTAAVLRWFDPSSIETGFEIEESNDGINFSYRSTVSPDSNVAVLIDSFYNDSTYYFRVRSLTSDRASEYTNVAWEKVQFNAPLNVRITDMNEDSAFIAWDDPHSFALKYDIYFTTNEAPFLRTLIVPGTERNAVIVNTAKYQTIKNYSFKIRARSNIQLSEFSNIATSPLIYPGPTELEVTTVNDDTVRLRWKDNARFGSFFRVEMQQNNGMFEPIKDVPKHFNTATVVYSFQKNKTYTFRAYLYSALNTTDYSNKVRTYFRDELFTGGSFTQAGTEGANNIAKWNGSTWGPIGSGISQPVYVLKKYFERIIIGGKQTITAWDNRSYSNILGSISGENEALYSMVDTNGQLLAGGTFSRLGNAQNGVGVFTGSNWSALGTGMNGPIYAVSFFQNNFIAAGRFSLASNSEIYNIAKRTNKWEPIGPGLPSTIYALAVYQNELYAGGSFVDTGRSLSFLAKWNQTQERWFPVGGTGITSFDSVRVYSMMVWNNELYVAGRFNAVNGVVANNIIKYNGTTWQAIGSGVDGVIRTMYIFGNRLYIGGRFNSAGGTTANNIAMWDGSSWVPLGAGVSGASATVYSMGTYGNWYWDLLP